MRSPPPTMAWPSVLISPKRSIMPLSWALTCPTREGPKHYFRMIGSKQATQVVINNPCTCPQGLAAHHLHFNKNTVKKGIGAKCESMIVASNGRNWPVRVFTKPLPTGRQSGLEKYGGRFFRNLSRDCEYDAVPLLTEFIPRVTNGPLSCMYIHV